SHKSPVGGKEEKVLIYNEKELNKAVDIVYPALCYQTGESSPDKTFASQSGIGPNMHPTELQIRN
ncbi:hypothetical protein NGG03_28125, partial [Klebsiella michiganensis]|nr:hypothetical protein [Klebsiella michiganensis]